MVITALAHIILVSSVPFSLLRLTLPGLNLTNPPLNKLCARLTNVVLPLPCNPTSSTSNECKEGV